MTKNANQPTATQVAGAKSWIGKVVGDSISGTILGFQTYTHPEYGKSPVVVLDTEDDDAAEGRVRLVYVTGVLLSQFKEMDGAQKGDRYTVISLGDQEGKREITSGPNKGQKITYHNYASYKGDAPELEETVDLSLFD